MGDSTCTALYKDVYRAALLDIHSALCPVSLHPITPYAIEQASSPDRVACESLNSNKMSGPDLLSLCSGNSQTAVVWQDTCTAVDCYGTHIA